MKKTDAHSRDWHMLEEPVNKVIPRLAAPAIVSMLVTAIYNTADTYFVSQISTAASAAVGVIFSAMALIQSIAFMLGMGSGSSLARCLGAGDEKTARRYASVGFFTAMGIGLVIAVAGVSFARPIVHFLGSTPTIEPHAVAYANYIFLAAPFIMCSFVMNNLLRFQGLSIYGMVGIATGGILNMVLDPIFIFALNMQTAGAALATAISQFVSFIILLLMCNLHSNVLSIRLRDFRPTLSMFGRIIYIGLPSLSRQGLASLSTIVLNTVARGWGDAAIAAMSIVTRVTMFINSAVIGFGQGFQPVCSFSFGARKYQRVKQAFFYCAKVTTLILVVACSIAFLFSGTIIQVFRRDDLEVIQIGTLALRAQVVTVVLWGYIVMGNMFTQSIGYGWRSTLIAISRQGIFLLPLLLIMPQAMGILGLQLAQPVADVLTFLFTILLVRGVIKELDALPQDAPAETP